MQDVILVRVSSADREVECSLRHPLNVQIEAAVRDDLNIEDIGYAHWRHTVVGNGDFNRVGSPDLCNVRRP